jgi:hypothetical protein
MAIKCSLLGHRFSGTSTEEEREEQGSEVVITITEVEICDRCGERRVVSENKEVTSLETAAESADAEETAGRQSGTDETASDDTGHSPTPRPDMDAAEDDAELLEGAESADAPEQTPTDDGATVDPAAGDDGAAAAVEETADGQPAADDGAVILEDEDERDPGQWPEDHEADDEADAAAEDGDATAEAGPDASSGTAGDDGGVVLDDAGESGASDAPAGPADADGTTEVESAGDTGGQSGTADDWPDEYGTDDDDAAVAEVDWPEEGDDGDDEWERAAGLTDGIDEGDVERTSSAAVTVPDGDFRCPDCGFETSVESSSLRAGDFCPECRRGTLEHHSEE